MTSTDPRTAPSAPVPVKLPPLARDEFLALFARHASGDRQATEEIARRNFGLVAKIARSLIRRRGFGSYDDAFSAGLAGLWVAIGKFDPARGNAFSTHATRWIRQHVTRQLMGDRMIHVPEPIMWDVLVSRRRGRPATVPYAREGEWAMRLSPLAGPDHQDVFSMLADDRAEDAGRVVADRELRAIQIKSLRAAVGELQDRDRSILCRLFGLGVAEASRSDIARDLKISPERVSQIRDRAIREVRARCGEARRLMVG